jgi:hypothetical protein
MSLSILGIKVQYEDTKEGFSKTLQVVGVAEAEAAPVFGVQH